MGPRRTSTPCLTLHPYRMVTYLRSRRPRLGDRHQLDRSGLPSLSLAPVLVSETSASLSITHQTADFQILTPPPAPQLPVIQLNTDPCLLVQLATAYRDWLPQPTPAPAPILAPSLFREEPFDAASCPKPRRTTL